MAAGAAGGGPGKAGKAARAEAKSGAGLRGEAGATKAGHESRMPSGRDAAVPVQTRPSGQPGSGNGAADTPGVRSAARRAKQEAALSAAADRFPELRGLTPGQSPRVLTVESDVKLQRLYDELASGGEPIAIDRYDGQWVRLPDGWSIGLRNDSSSGGRTIDLRSPQGDTVKVHIAR